MPPVVPPAPPPVVQVVSPPPAPPLAVAIAPSPPPTAHSSPTGASLRDFPRTGHATQLGQPLAMGPMHSPKAPVLAEELDQLFTTLPATPPASQPFTSSDLDPALAQALGNTLAILPAIATDSTPPPTPTSPTPPGTQSLPEILGQTPASPGDSPPAPILSEDLQRLELKADRQEYDQKRQVVTASGKVWMKFRGAILQSDNLEVDIPASRAIAQGNVTLTRGEQILTGDRFDYNFVESSGVVTQAQGEISLPKAQADLSLQTPPSNVLAPTENLGDRILAGQPQNITSPGGIGLSVGDGERERIAEAAGFGFDQEGGGSLNRLRFQAETITFTAEGWEAVQIVMTNDPFDPAELKLIARSARQVQLKSGRRAVQASRPRLVIDDGLTLPSPLSRVVIDDRERDSLLPRVGFDDEDRGGLYLDRSFEILGAGRVQWNITPQFYLQRFFEESDGNPLNADNFGLTTTFKADLGPRTTLKGLASLTSLDLSHADDELRASLRLQQRLGLNTLAIETSFRDRLFNGSLGFQTVQSSLGVVLLSPSRPLGKTGFGYNYQVGFQRIRAESDRLDLVNTEDALARFEQDPQNNSLRDDGLVTLNRYQGSAALFRSFPLWRGKALPPTRSEGLRYSPIPVVPYLTLNTGIQGTLSLYSSDDTQGFVAGWLGLEGQVGHFSKSWFDYTGFQVQYLQGIRGDESPFRFDRAEDTQVLSASILQQIHGPVRFGVQFATNLATGEAIRTTYLLEYSRRTFDISLRYDPVLALGGLNIRINSFNWNRGPGALGGVGASPVGVGGATILESE